jgi:hypothetical protein
LGDVATTPTESMASTSVPTADAHLSVVFEDIFLSLPGTTRRFMVSGDLTLTVGGSPPPQAEIVLRKR